MTFCHRLMAVVCFSGVLGVAQAESFKEAEQVALKGALASSEQQARYEQLDTAHQEALAEWVNLQIQLGQQQRYVAHLESLVGSQQSELESQAQERANILELEQSLLPLMMDMVDGLARLVAADQPLLQEERQQRVTSLQQLMVRADVSNAEKLRRIIQAYNIELSYGQQIERESRSIATPEGTVQVDVVNLGRLALIAVAPGQQSAWLWQDDQWQAISAEHARSLQKMEAIRNKQAVPAMLPMPMPAQARLTGEGN